MNSLKQQRGAVLIVSLVLLLIMTLLGISSMNNTIMEERMAGNLRNNNLAFQSAEAALRAGEGVVGDWTGKPIANNSASNGVYLLEGPDPDSTNASAWWQEWSETDWSTSGNSYLTALKHKYTGATLEAPRYVIEEYEVVQDSINVGQQQDFGGRQYYQITSRGKGSDGRSVVMLRSTFARRF